MGCFDIHISFATVKVATKGRGNIPDGGLALESKSLLGGRKETVNEVTVDVKFGVGIVDGSSSLFTEFHLALLGGRSL